METSNQYSGCLLKFFKHEHQRHERKIVFDIDINIFIFINKSSHITGQQSLFSPDLIDRQIT
jgi:hypothetical protein